MGTWTHTVLHPNPQSPKPYIALNSCDLVAGSERAELGGLLRRAFLSFFRFEGSVDSAGVWGACWPAGIVAGVGGRLREWSEVGVRGTGDAMTSVGCIWPSNASARFLTTHSVPGTLDSFKKEKQVL